MSLSDSKGIQDFYIALWVTLSDPESLQMRFIDYEAFMKFSVVSWMTLSDPASLQASLSNSEAI